MKTDIQNFKAADLLARLAQIAPSIAIETIWEHDADARWDIDDPDLDADDFTAWQSEVRASAIVAGKIVHGSAYMSGTWEKFGDKPAQSNPEISGYLPQMIAEAACDLSKQLPAGHPAQNEIQAITETV